MKVGYNLVFAFGLPMLFFVGMMMKLMQGRVRKDENIDSAMLVTNLFLFIFLVIMILLGVLIILSKLF